MVEVQPTRLLLQIARQEAAPAGVATQVVVACASLDAQYVCAALSYAHQSYLADMDALGTVPDTQTVQAGANYLVSFKP